MDTSRPAVFARPGSRGALSRVPAYALGGMTAYNIAELTAEFGTIAGVEIPWPLFPADLFGAAPQAKLLAVG